MVPYRKFVVLIDDDPADLFLFRRLLERAGFAVIATTQLEVAMCAIVAGEVGCVITDQRMPVSGQELLAHLGAARSDVDAIMLSGAEAPREGLPAGAMFIRKDEGQLLVETV